MKLFHIAGSRVVKTAVAIFVTAWLCELLNWPPVFAVITAIVTLEPTVSDSIKKGLVRFPASAIGSAYAVLFIALFGDSPLTYTLAAVFTIVTCYRLKLHAGLLVATLTAVAMVEVIHSNYFISFVIRLGTTTIGLIVSSVVNMFILPPDYTENIVKNIQRIGKRTGITIQKVFRDILEDKPEENNAERKLMDQLDRKIHQTETLIRFQREESKYHPLAGHEKSKFQHAQEQLRRLRLIQYHLDNLVNTPLKTNTWTSEEKSLILHAVTELAQGMQQQSYYNPAKHQQQLKQLTELFWEDNEEITKKNDVHPTTFPPELIILYELLSIYNLVTQYYRET
ncbi:aromatic acid exporter family protein [Oceanobacillus halotolerans]|uniref:aromatic acid exporter family protein n=1 Tax=Oceanobacillus halotolerans TaxID=2663380 RepID=UPI0013DB0555|nr:aromatic acid exporter family protein [Oceanobacillus halotolerans]